MQFTINGLHILGIATVVPRRITHISDMGDVFGSADIERIINSSGVQSIRSVDEKICASDLCIQASEHLLSKICVDRTTIDAVIFVSQTPDYRLPATSALMQQRLGLRNDVLAFDINYGCSGYIYGLVQAAMLLSATTCNKVLVCAGDTITKLIHPKDRSAKVLFGDAGSATIIERGYENWPFHFYTDGSGEKHLFVPAGGSRIPYHSNTCIEFTDEEGNIRTQNNLYMNGMEIMNFALKYVPLSVEGVLVESKLNKEDINAFIFHQANKLMLDFLIKKMKLPKDSAPIALQNTGNTGPASIPLAISIKWRELSEKTSLQKTLFCGFGVGLSTASTIVDLSKTLILGPCEYGS
ncbi:MAG: ketoacyl-ACP synthase III [Firmicutes bacterium]|nr:ketoacyl-ACP synthase III [Bacillota bacterium]